MITPTQSYDARRKREVAKLWKRLKIIARGTDDGLFYEVMKDKKAKKLILSFAKRWP